MGSRYFGSERAAFLVCFFDKLAGVLLLSKIIVTAEREMGWDLSHFGYHLAATKRQKEREKLEKDEADRKVVIWGKGRPTSR
jgi:hypothetical protein